MKYILTRSETSGTTGYYGAIPEPAPDLETGLAMLEDRPGDIFLKRYLASLLPDPASPAFLSLSRSHCDSRELAAFLDACARLCADAKTRESRDAWRALLNGGAGAPRHAFTAPELAACRSEMARRVSVLQDPVEARPFSDDTPDQNEFLAQVLEKLAAAGLLGGQEMRHEASLSPIALLRDWPLETGSDFGLPYRLSGTLTAYGRGLSLIQARISCLMEIVERASAFAAIDAQGRLNQKNLVRASHRDLVAAGERCLDPRLFNPDASMCELAWIMGEDAAGDPVYAPAQAACLFLNPGEPDLGPAPGSTGLGAGATREQARLAALLEVIERDCVATSPFCASACFIPASRDPMLQALFDDYRYRGIFLQMQDITSELGVPCYRSFVTDRSGRLVQAAAANLNGKKAALAAITETPWPYSWATGMPSPSGRGLPDLPIRFLEDLPAGPPTDAASLDLLEQTLTAMGLMPVYVDLTRPDLDLPVYRAFVPGLEFDTELEAGPSLRLVARYLEQCHE